MRRRPLAVVATLLALITAPAGAQQVIDFGLAAGPALGDPQQAVASGGGAGEHWMAGVGVAPRGWPVALRADLLWVRQNHLQHGPVALTAVAVFPLRRGGAALTPYLLGGPGLYGLGTRGLAWGLAGGGGVAWAAGPLTVFAEGRYHTETSSAAVLGLRF